MKGKRFVYMILAALMFLSFLLTSEVPANWRRESQGGMDVASKRIQPQASLEEVGLYAIIQNGKWGYMDKRGKTVIQPRFENAAGFSEGLAAVRIRVGSRGQWGYIDQRGLLIIVPQYEIAGDFHDGVARVYNARSLDSPGKYIDTSGNSIQLPPAINLKNLWEFSGGLAKCEFIQDDKRTWGFINPKGEIAINPIYSSVGEFSEGLAFVKPDNNKYGYIDTKGKMIIGPIYGSAQGFSDGLAAVNVDGKWGYIDKTGRMIIRPNLDLAYEFSEGLATVRVDGRVGYINKTGKMEIAPQFLNASQFSEGLAAANSLETAKKWGYIDQSGKWAIPPQWAGEGRPGMFRGGLAYIDLRDGQARYIDKSGNIIWKNY